MFSILSSQKNHRTSSPSTLNLVLTTYKCRAKCKVPTAQSLIHPYGGNHLKINKFLCIFLRGCPPPLKVCLNFELEFSYKGKTLHLHREGYQSFKTGKMLFSIKKIKIRNLTTCNLSVSRILNCHLKAIWKQWGGGQPIWSNLLNTGSSAIIFVPQTLIQRFFFPFYSGLKLNLSLKFEVHQKL